MRFRGSGTGIAWGRGVHGAHATSVGCKNAPVPWWYRRGQDQLNGAHPACPAALSGVSTGFMWLPPWCERTAVHLVGR